MPNAKTNRVNSALALGFIGTVAVALVAIHPLFAMLAFGGLAYFGFQVAERLRPPRKTAGQFAYLYVFWMFIFLLPFAAVSGFVYVFAQAGRTYGEWTVLGTVFVVATVGAYLFQGFFESKERDKASPADSSDH